MKLLFLLLLVFPIATANAKPCYKKNEPNYSLKAFLSDAQNMVEESITAVYHRSTVIHSLACMAAQVKKKNAIRREEYKWKFTIQESVDPFYFGYKMTILHPPRKVKLGYRVTGYCPILTGLQTDLGSRPPKMNTHLPKTEVMASWTRTCDSQTYPSKSNPSDSIKKLYAYIKNSNKKISHLDLFERALELRHNDATQAMALIGQTMIYGLKDGRKGQFAKNMMTPRLDFPHDRVGQMYHWWGYFTLLNIYDRGRMNKLIKLGAWLSEQDDPVDRRTDLMAFNDIRIFKCFLRNNFNPIPNLTYESLGCEKLKNPDVYKTDYSMKVLQSKQIIQKLKKYAYACGGLSKDQLY